MARERAAGKAVILLGDLNMAHRFSDGGWSGARLHVSRLIGMLETAEETASAAVEEAAPAAEEPAAAEAVAPAAAAEQTAAAEETTPAAAAEEAAPVAEEPATAEEAARVAESAHQLRRQIEPTFQILKEHWPTVQAALTAKTHEPKVTTNPQTKVEFDRFVVTVLNTEGASVTLGKPCITEKEALLGYRVDGYGVTEDGTMLYGDSSREANHVLKKPGMLSGFDLMEAMLKVTGIELDPAHMRLLALFSNEHLGISDSLNPSEKKGYLGGMLEQEDMVDAFAHFWPDAERRATCWSQYTNERYINNGRRIDYTLVDRAFFDQYAMRGEAPLSTGGSELDANSAEAALAACTLNGLYQQVSFHGGGMQELVLPQFNAQFQPPGTNLLYTPPQLSDHIGTTLLLRSGAIGQVAPAKYDAATRKCQPHQQTPSITSFFGQKAAVKPDASAKATCDSRAVKRKACAGVAAESNKKTAFGAISRAKPKKPPAAAPKKKTIPTTKGTLGAFFQKKDSK